MTPAAAISRAASPPTHYVCGVPLLPYSIGHARHLLGAGVSFVTGAYHQMPDLISGILVCSESYEGFAGSLQRGEMERAIARWNRRLSGGFFGVWKRRGKRVAYWLCNRVPILRSYRARFLVTPRDVIGFDFVEECRKFEHYIDEHGGGEFRINDWSVPNTASTHKEPTAAVQAPPTEQLLSALVSEAGLDESEVLNMPLPLARWKWAIHAERKGWCKFVNTTIKDEAQESANDFARRVFSGEIDPVTMEARA